MSYDTKRCCGLAGLIFGHKFEPRYHKGAATGTPKMDGPSIDVLDMIEKYRPITYLGDTCVRCGRIMEARSKA
jgi:hypothetical protein